MKARAIVLASGILALCGCLSPSPEPAVSRWLMEFRGSPSVAGAPAYGIVRLSQVVVAAPYAGERIVVLKRDGTVALDAYNVFAASPSALLKGLCLFSLKASGLFSEVIGTSSGASASVSAEVIVDRMALDCRQEDERRAVVELRIRLLRGKEIVATVEGDAFADASDGDYGAAFSKAVSAAVSAALSRLR